jgi:D-sedoheptulose 7-phosphate isomerase
MMDIARSAASSPVSSPGMREAIIRKARESADTTVRFFEENAEALEGCARALASRLASGGRLWVMGNGGSACDAQHIAVEFMHPIVEKRRAFAAHALTVDTATLTAIGNDSDFSRVFAAQLELVAGRGDAALGISTSGASANVGRALKRARELGLLTIGFAGRDGGRLPELCDWCFTVRSWSIHRIQEAHTALLHVLWDVVHVALGEDDVL